MPRHTQTRSNEANGKPPKDRSVSVLVVDNDRRVGEQVSRCLGQDQVRFIQVSSAAEAFKRLNKEPVDLAFIESNLPDGSGLALAKRLQNGYAMTHTIVMADQPSLGEIIEAVRAGAIDVIMKPLKPEELKQRIEQAMSRLREDQKNNRRVKKLRRICKKLNQAREEIASQVDILCNDLVVAYQELAQQVAVMTQTKEFTSLVRQELDLEAVLRRTLEYLLQKVGPTNAAIFLPANGDPEEYSLGGYVNYECTSESAEILLQNLADVLAPKVAQTQWPLHFTDNQALTEWLGEEFAPLSDSHVLAFSCHHEEESLAIVVLFRHQTQPFSRFLVQSCTSIAPLLAQSLAKVVSIHHRLGDDEQDEQDETSFG